MKTHISVKNLLRSLVIFAIILLSVQNAKAQQPDTKGTDFWLAFPGNYGGGGTLSFFISGESSTTGSVTANGFSTTFSITPGSVTQVSLPQYLNINTHNLVENKGIHVTANDEVTIYGLSQQTATTDAYVALPTDILGTEYIALNFSQNLPSQLTIVASENSTSVTITSTETVSGFTSGVARTITLDQGQTFQVRSSDGTGTLVTSDKPIGLFGGSECTNIPSNSYYACDHIVEMIPPTSTWGKNFVVMPLATRNGSTYRILASENSTAVNINGSLAATLNKGEFYQTTTNIALNITSDKPVLVGQYANSSSYDNAVADPFFMIIPPYEQYLGSYTIATPGSGFTSHWANIIVPAAAVGNAKLDGSVISSSDFSAIGSSGFYGATIEITNGTHTIYSDYPIGAHIYGWGNYDSYGYPGGASLSPVAFVDDLSVSPTSANLSQHSQHCITATVKDNLGDPVAGIRVDFAVSGANNTGGFATTDANGEATFCYTGDNGGNDDIDITTGSLSASATAYFAPCSVDITETHVDQVCGVPGSIDLTVNGAASPYTISWTGPDSYTSTSEDLSDLQPGTYNATVQDANGCQGNISVEIKEGADIIKPTIVTQDVTVSLDANGSTTVTTADVDYGTTDNCSTADLYFTTAAGTICAMVPEHDLLSISAPSGTIITAVDFASYGMPEGTCNNFTQGWCHSSTSQSVLEDAALGKNSFSIYAENSIFGDPCYGTFKKLYVQVTYSTLSNSITYGCSDVGTHVVPVAATDASGNTSLSTVNVTVNDDTNPVAVTQDITVTLDANGEVTISASDINNGSSDNCSVASYELDKTSFDCSNVGDNTVTLTVKDPSGNMHSATATVTVKTTLAANAGNDATVYYGYSPMASTTLSGSATGGGGTYSYAWSNGASTKNITVSPTSTTTYTLTVTDNNGCVSTDKVTVNVVDVRCGSKLDKVSVCHNGNTICIAASAVPSHLSNHGSDYIGACQSNGKKETSFTEDEQENASMEEETAFIAGRLTAYPNPFSSNATIEFSITKDQFASLEIYNVEGKLVKSLFNGDLSANTVYKVNVDAGDMKANMYFARLTTGSQVQHIKLILVR
ncbi:MAG: T9SS type A sorting domain-containing protein [Sphingobacteriales bacterium]|nr:MAG: T9SS type A sorting domain-containing protein [Sphingobacteriales bacterium]